MKKVPATKKKKLPGKLKGKISSLRFKRHFSTFLNGLIGVGMTVGISTMALAGHPRWLQHDFKELHNMLHSVEDPIVNPILLVCLGLVVIPIILIVLFCIQKCPRCGEKFEYPKYTSDPEECKSCQLSLK